MSRKSPIEQLKNCAGRQVVQLNLERWIADSGPQRPIISVNLVLDSGQSFVLGCAGDGSVFVKRGQIELIPNETVLESADCINGEVLNSVVVLEDKIELLVGKNYLVVSNVCDEIEVEILEGENGVKYRF